MSAFLGMDFAYVIIPKMVQVRENSQEGRDISSPIFATIKVNIAVSLANFILWEVDGGRNRNEKITIALEISEIAEYLFYQFRII